MLCFYGDLFYNFQSEKPGFAGRGITLMHDYVMEMPSVSFAQTEFSISAFGIIYQHHI